MTPRVLVDTSGLYALFDREDVQHGFAAQAWAELRHAKGTELHTTSYVLLELNALLRQRLGMEAVRDLEEAIRPLLNTVWVDQDLHDAGIKRHLEHGRHGPSLVDCVSFAYMVEASIAHAFAFDRHFVEAGFKVIPR